MAIEEQVVSLFAGTRGYLDGIALNKVGAFERQAQSELRARHPEILEAIRTDREIKKETDAKLSAFFAAFAKQFT